MAEIRVERKPQRKIWPLILGILVAALLVWGLLAMMDNDRNDRNARNAAQPQQSSLVPVTLAAPDVNLDLARAA
ncbi:MAG TPA: hypothetical protein VKM72_30620 [Thermoanaerobaculia bacterium]|nr:hypothetical protein [Thermoanaerobaculia bacterium]